MLEKLLLLLAILSLTSVTSFQSTGIRHVQYANPSKLRSQTVKDEEISEESTRPIAEDPDSIYFEKGFGGGSNKPASAFILGSKFFVKQSKALGLQGLANVGLIGRDLNREVIAPQKLGLTLSNQAVKDAEVRREARDGRVETNAVARKLYDVGCYVLDELFTDRPIARFWFLETIARIPYFTYVSMLHLYESFGWWRGVQLRKVHNAEEYNELHHLLIMEALGGDAIWSDRFLGYHIAIGYYWALIVVFFFSPAVAYEFMELLESHAVDTYSTFLNENEEELKKLPAPAVAKSYYTSDDLYLFDDFQVSKKAGSRRPSCDTLYDVFQNICEDEAEHVKTMVACQDYARVGKLVESPHVPAMKRKTGSKKDEEDWGSRNDEMQP
ncbi:unnamed protein product [Cylindrotheca closterium]|uniref:Ubiquinol oxidase n=1 Tax=Cylindrotheca closterium TaxID=2856 RepID=A0AAD2CDA7_9STRA|nr:unnamed protein product [Cylindrotheca closterium]